MDKKILSQSKQYKNLLANTKNYRKSWKNGLKLMIIETLNEINEKSELNGSIKEDEKIEHLEFIVFSLGQITSDIAEHINEKTERHLIKDNGMLVYQQLFNGKIQVWIGYPFVERITEQRQPKQVEILRPEELKKEFIYRHFEIFMKEIIDWEDYDDDVNNKIGFNQPQIGFMKTGEEIEQ